MQAKVNYLLIFSPLSWIGRIITYGKRICQERHHPLSFPSVTFVIFETVQSTYLNNYSDFFKANDTICSG